MLLNLRAPHAAPLGPTGPATALEGVSRKVRGSTGLIDQSKGEVRKWLEQSPAKSIFRRSLGQNCCLRCEHHSVPLARPWPRDASMGHSEQGRWQRRIRYRREEIPQPEHRDNRRPNAGELRVTERTIVRMRPRWNTAMMLAGEISIQRQLLVR